MKRYAFILLFALCLAGCGKTAADTAQSYENINYTLENIDDQRAVIDDYQRLSLKADFDRGMTWGELSSFVSEEEKNSKKFRKEIESIDVQSELDKMDDITEDIVYDNNSDVRIYAYKQNPSFMISKKIRDNSAYINLCGEVFERVEEYEDLTESICKRSGLFYNGVQLGKIYDSKKMNGFEDNPEVTDTENLPYKYFRYTGMNSIAFANPEFLLKNEFYEDDGKRVFKNAPLRAVFYMDKDEIKYIYIYWLSGVQAPVLSEKNLQSLDFDDQTGKTAQTLAERFFNTKKSANGTENGIKYKYRPNIAKNTNDTRYSVLVLEV